MNGFVVTVGCQSVVFNDLKIMAGEIERYYRDPVATELAYRNTSINKMMEAPEPDCPGQESPILPTQRVGGPVEARDGRNV